MKIRTRARKEPPGNARRGRDILIRWLGARLTAHESQALRCGSGLRRASVCLGSNCPRTTHRARVASVAMRLRLTARVSFWQQIDHPRLTAHESQPLRCGPLCDGPHQLFPAFFATDCIPAELAVATFATPASQQFGRYDLDGIRTQR